MSLNLEQLFMRYWYLKVLFTLRGKFRLFCNSFSNSFLNSKMEQNKHKNIGKILLTTVHHFIYLLCFPVKENSGPCHSLRFLKGFLSTLSWDFRVYQGILSNLIANVKAIQSLRASADFCVCLFRVYFNYSSLTL